MHATKSKMMKTKTAEEKDESFDVELMRVEVRVR
jgi:hypothetical protein